jgi:hypothetical protein
MNQNVVFVSNRKLTHEVLSLIKRRLGLEKFNQDIWQQDGAKPHQAHIFMDWLDGIFGSSMLALKAVQGYFWSPASLDMNPCDFFLRRVIKDKVYNTMLVTMDQLKGRDLKAKESDCKSLAVKNQVKENLLIVIMKHSVENKS